MALEAEIKLAGFESKNTVLPVGVDWLEKIAGGGSVGCRGENEGHTLIDLFRRGHPQRRRRRGRRYEMDA